MSSEQPITKENLDTYLKELAKEFRKRSGKNMPAEIILIGGASVVINYGFRDMTYDMDAIIDAASTMEDAIKVVGDRYGLPNGWLNTDFMKTRSYTPKIIQFSTYYKTFSNVVTFRTVTGEYLVAMKLMAGRQYKYDLSDVIGILLDHKKKGSPILLEMVKAAAGSLYGSYDAIPELSRAFIENAIASEDYEELYDSVRRMEADNKDILVSFQDQYPDVLKADNADSILETIRKKQKKNSGLK